MGKYKDLRGKKYCHLTVVGDKPKIENAKTYWLCKCECGNEKYINAGRLNSGNVKSCGCIKNSRNSGHHKTQHKRLIKILNSMKQRCYNPNDTRYKNYGARGIKICDEWLKDSKKFYGWAECNGYKDNLSIDRIDVNGNYEPNNCRWVTFKEQANNKRVNHLVTIRGKTRTIAQWAEYYKVSYGKAYNILAKLGR